MSAVLKLRSDHAQAYADTWGNLEVSLENLRSYAPDLYELSERSFATPPIIIVGAGPAAQECARQLSAGITENEWLLVINGEQYLPYHRAQLSSVLASRRGVDALIAHDFAPNVELINGVKITVVDRQSRTITTGTGTEFCYRKLVLATGSQSRRPMIPGLHGSRVFDFRQLQDVEKIAALAPGRVAVLGGGLLGIEAARALRCFCNEVTIFERASYLLSRQVDRGAGERLAWHLRALGIHVSVDARLVSAETNFGQATLLDEENRSHHFDAIVCATGISPNVELAEHAQLQYHLGIEVNDEQQTSDPDIYAIGECSERKGQTAGNLSTSLNHARRAARSMLSQPISPQEPADVFQLKMDSCVAVAIGNVNQQEDASIVCVPDQRSYYRVIVENQHVVGAILVGDIGLDFSAFTDAVEHRLPWSDGIEKRFRKTGELPHSGNVSPDAVICFCAGVTYGKLCELRDANLSHDSITQQTGASLHCGSCTQRVALITTGAQQATKNASAKGLWVAITLTTLLISALCSALVIPFAHSWQSHWRMVDVVWRSGVIRQVTGYLLFGLLLLAFWPAWRRRAQRQQQQRQKPSLLPWHAVAVCVVIIGFIAHTGMRFGYGLNANINLVFIAALLCGALSGMTWRHASKSSHHRTLAVNMRALHWASLFPLPALLIFHILKAYYF